MTIDTALSDTAPPGSASPICDPSSIQSFERKQESIQRQILLSISHDLRSPLSSIMGALEVYERMKDKLTPEKQASLIEVALRETHRLDAFITNVLDMAELENGLVHPKPEPVDVAMMLRQCLTKMEYSLRGSIVEIRNSAENIQAVTDPFLLSRAVCLILDNAVKYGGQHVNLFIELKADGKSKGSINIRDNGPGIPPGLTEAIFQKYVRLGDSNKHNTTIGLGLPIARSIMRLLNGNIVADAAPEGGSAFTISFPLV